MKTLVLGATTDPTRYSYLAINKLLDHQQQVVAVGHSGGQVRGIEIQKEFPKSEDIDTVTMYLNPRNQQQYYNSIVSAKPRRIIFNPGAENTELAKLATENGIEVENACTLVLLNTGQY